MFGASPSGRALGAWRPEPLSRTRVPPSGQRASPPIRVTIPDAGRRKRRARRAPARAHSVPRPAFGGAMLTLLRVGRAARLRRRPELDGASRPLHSAGSWQPSFCECKAFSEGIRPHRGKGAPCGVGFASSVSTNPPCFQRGRLRIWGSGVRIPPSAPMISTPYVERAVLKRKLERCLER